MKPINFRYSVTKTEIRTNPKWGKISKEDDGAIRVVIPFSELREDMVLFKPDRIHRREVREFKDLLTQNIRREPLIELQRT